MKLAATRSEEKRQQTKMKERNAELWILRNNIPEDLKPIIMRHIRYRLQDNKGVDVESLLSILPMEHRTILKENLCLPMLKKVSSSASISFCYKFSVLTGYYLIKEYFVLIFLITNLNSIYFVN